MSVSHRSYLVTGYLIDPYKLSELVKKYTKYWGLARYPEEYFEEHYPELAVVVSRYTPTGSIIVGLRSSLYEAQDTLAVGVGYSVEDALQRASEAEQEQFTAMLENLDIFTGDLSWYLVNHVN